MNLLSTSISFNRWFSYLGNPDENPLVPLRITYILTENNSNAMNLSTFQCNEAYEVILSIYQTECLICVRYLLPGKSVVQLR